MSSTCAPAPADYTVVPGFFAVTIGLTWWGLSVGVPPLFISGLAVGPVAIVAAVLERVRPHRADQVAFDQPLGVDAAHFLLNYQLGYAMAMAGCGALAELLPAMSMDSLWPSAWPLGAQLVLACLLAEGVSYWQHRAVHRVRWLWPFHALHHRGPRLNLVRAGRFHFIDISAGAFLVFAPVVALGAPVEIVLWLASLGGVLGVLQHANMRAPTPAWLDRLICTPAVHRHHHSRRHDESNTNYGTLVMLFDVLFGTFEQPRPGGPEAIGIEGDTHTGGWWAQVVDPFAQARRAAPVSRTHMSKTMTSSRTLALVALCAIAMFCIHCDEHLDRGDLDQLLWLSNAATLLLAAACLVESRAWVAVSWCWLSLSCLLWGIDIANGSPIDSAVLTHVGSWLLAAVALRVSGRAPPQWWGASAGLVGLVVAARLLGSAEHNVNLAFGIGRGWDWLEIPYPAYITMLAAVAAFAFFVADKVRRRVFDSA